LQKTCIIKAKVFLELSLVQRWLYVFCYMSFAIFAICPLLFLLYVLCYFCSQKTYKLFGFSIFSPWAYMMKVIPETRPVHLMRYLHQTYGHSIRLINSMNHIGVVMISVLALSAVDRRLEHRSGQTKDYNIGICCFSVKHEALRRKSKYCSARNQNNVFEWSDMSTRGHLFQWASTIQIQLNMLV
jgi:hypothetical protein